LLLVRFSFVVTSQEKTMDVTGINASQQEQEKEATAAAPDELDQSLKAEAASEEVENTRSSEPPSSPSPCFYHGVGGVWP
jgi:hypothetical protein